MLKHTYKHRHTLIYMIFIYSEPLIQTQDEAFYITTKNEKHSSILFYRVFFVFQSQNTTRTGFSSITFLISVSSADNPVQIISIWPSQKRILLSFSYWKLLSTYIFTGYISIFERTYMELTFHKSSALGAVLLNIINIYSLYLVSQIYAQWL